MDKTTDKTKGVEETRKNRVRITLTCRNVKNVERGKCLQIVYLFQI